MVNAVVDVEDDDFMRRYEAALIPYEAKSYEAALDSAFRPYPSGPDRDLEHWALTGPTAFGGGFHSHIGDLYWLCPEGVAINVSAAPLHRESVSREEPLTTRQRLYEILNRWRRNRY